MKWIIIMGFLLGGCAENTKTKPVINPPYTARQENLKWKALAPLVKKHFKTDMTVEEIAAELSYQNYLMNKDKK